MRKTTLLFLMLFFLLGYIQVKGSHIVGGEATYKFLGPDYSTGALRYKYEVSITIYEDCQNGQPSAILADDPAFLAAYDSSGGLPINVDTSVHFSSSMLVPANFSNLCVSNPPVVCLLKKTFIKTYILPPSPKGYVISYQRCCRNASIVNITDPGDVGATYFCKIPPTGIASTNNSAIFKNYPPQIICINNPLIYDHAATDADGDSLTYEFCQSLKGATNTAIKPIPAPPPYEAVNYVSPYTYLHPMPGLPEIQIDKLTGLITGTPNRLGRFLVTICCHEWRNGIMINTVIREFQFVVTNCSKAVIADIPQFSSAPNTYLVNCKDYTVHFNNSSIGGSSYLWNFGSSTSSGNTSTLFEPTFTYPDTGTYIVNLKVNPGSTCTDSIWRYVKIYPYLLAKFIDTGAQCIGNNIGFIDNTSSTYKQITSYTWSFGDGTFSTLTNPNHIYTEGGIYNVMLIVENIKNCIDTAVNHHVVQNFTPFAGNDTIIVKDEKIEFHAIGGVDYFWSPSTYLNNTNIYNPSGHFPDTGSFTYYVHVSSAYGCEGYDTIKVRVVPFSSFFMPNAFSPNGDGKNDVFRPVAIGYSNLNYFQIFDRWGELVYYSKDFETGWGGTLNGKPMQMGTYFWEISYTDRFGKQGFLKGDVSLIR